MIKNSLLVLGIFSIVFTSCQKELSIDSNGGSAGGGTSGDLLAKIVLRTGTDSTVSEYEYDANKRLIREKVSGVSQGTNLNNELRIVRNSSGIITSTVQKSDDLAAQGIDSLITLVNYNSSTQRYTSRLLKISYFGLTILDSTAIIYDGGSKIIREDDYLDNPILGPLPILTAKTEYTNGPSGITQINFSYGDPTTLGPLDLQSTLSYTYDGKVSPLILPAGEAAVILRADLSATANSSKLDYQDIANGGANSFIQTIVYSYNAKNKPISAVGTETPGSIISNITYYYK